MKKLIYIGLILAMILGMGSCSYDDSNDLDVLTPNDSTQTAKDKNLVLLY
ncbi:hypothetical protein [Ulvibacterium sp.]|nr:hypothetical protein [Ulvibacterium sp.]